VSSRYEKTLSEAQRRVFRLLCEGFADKKIAKELGLSQHTVHNHTRAIFQAFGVHSRVELLVVVAKAVESTHA
jgi:DNA-binding NarL/FixJ family response regulator